MKKRVLWIAAVLILAGLAGYILISGGKAVQVETAKVTRGSIEEYVEETGHLVTEDETEIYASISGKVEEVPRKEGEEVKAGDLLARLDESEVKLEIEALEAQKSLIKAKYAEALSPADEEEINRLKAQLRSAEAAYEEAKRTADDSKSLFEAGAISLDTYRSTVSGLAAAEASLETARSNLLLAEKGVSENIKKQYDAQLSEINTYIEQLKLKLKDTVIKSPIDGLLLSVNIKEGSIIQPGMKLFEIGGLKGFYIECNVLTEDIKDIHPGSLVYVDGEDFGIDNMTGTVRKIYPKAESIMSDLGIEQKRVKLEIQPDSPVKGLRPGYDVTLKIITQRREDTLLVDEKAVFRYQGKDHVFVKDNGVAVLREIKKGLESDGQVEILDGLKEGEEVILSPDKNLKEGSRVK